MYKVDSPPWGGGNKIKLLGNKRIGREGGRREGKRGKGKGLAKGEKKGKGRWKGKGVKEKGRNSS